MDMLRSIDKQSEESVLKKASGGSEGFAEKEVFQPGVTEWRMMRVLWRVDRRGSAGIA